MLGSLGYFVFNIDTVPYQGAALKSVWRHPKNPRIGTIAASQYTGREADTITLNCSLRPEINGGIGTINFLKAMADTGGGWPYIRGNGEYLGMFEIESIDQNESNYHMNGTPKEIEFSMTLCEVDDEQAGDMGAAILAWL